MSQPYSMNTLTREVDNRRHVGLTFSDFRLLRISPNSSWIATQGIQNDSYRTIENTINLLCIKIPDNAGNNKNNLRLENLIMDFSNNRFINIIGTEYQTVDIITEKSDSFIDNVEKKIFLNMLRSNLNEEEGVTKGYDEKFWRQFKRRSPYLLRSLLIRYLST